MNESIQRYGYINGEILSEQDMHLSPFDLGVLRGYGVFDVMRTEKGRPFLLERHFDRLKHSAEMLHLRIPVAEEAYRAIIEELLAKNSFEKANIRTVLTGGPSEDAFSLAGNETFFILVTPFHGLEEKYYEQGAKVMTLSFGRQLPSAKITQHVMAIKNTDTKKEAGALEILYIQEGKVLEASTSNFGVFLGDTLVMPNEGVLRGVTAGLTLELARECGFRVEERDLLWNELPVADEAFLTATNKYIVPVTRVDEHLVADGKVGERTKKLMQVLQQFCERY